MRYVVAILTIGLLTLVAVALPGAGQTIPPVVYLPIIANQPTVTPTATTAPTATATPIATATPSSTSSPTPTATVVFLYICDRDAYNCSDFSTQAQAQTVFDYCVAQGFGDIHKLDQNNDGEACESLP